MTALRLVVGRLEALASSGVASLADGGSGADGIDAFAAWVARARCKVRDPCPVPASNMVKEGCFDVGVDPDDSVGSP